jgi:NAD(P)-dependent dehydrogenase (short-subunit alcohol dehydrogenase family)
VNNAAYGGVEFLRGHVHNSVSSEEEVSTASLVNCRSFFLEQRKTLLCVSEQVYFQQLIGMDRDQRLEWLWNNRQETYGAARKGLQTNYYGVKRVIEALLPLLLASTDGRIVNVSSDFGQLRVG